MSSALARAAPSSSSRAWYRDLYCSRSRSADSARFSSAASSATWCAVSVGVGSPLGAAEAGPPVLVIRPNANSTTATSATCGMGTPRLCHPYVKPSPIVKRRATPEVSHACGASASGGPRSGTARAGDFATSQTRLAPKLTRNVES